MPTKVFGIAISIDENGSVSRNTQHFGNNGSMSDNDIFSKFNFDGNNLIIKTTEQFLLETDKEINISSTVDANIAMSYSSKNINIESDHKIIFGGYDINKLNTLTIKNTTIKLNPVYDYKNVIIENCNTFDSEGYLNGQNSRNSKLLIKNSTLTFSSGINSYAEIEIKDSTISLGSILCNSNDGIKMTVDNSTINSSFLQFTNNNIDNEHITFNKSILNINSIQGNFMGNDPNKSFVIINMTDSKIINSQINYIIINANNSEISGYIHLTKLNLTDSKLNFTSLSSPKEIIANNTTITGVGSIMMHNTDDKLSIINSNVDVESEFDCQYCESANINDSTVKAGKIYIDNFNIDNSKIQSNNFYSVSSYNSSVSISNSTFKLNQFYINGNQKNLLIDNSFIETESFDVYNLNGLKFNKSKVIVSKYAYLKYFDFYHSYFLVNNTTDTPENISTYNFNVNNFYTLTNKMSSNVIATDLNNNFINPIEADENHTVYNNVLLRDKLSITFKIVNGTWSDGTTNDIVLEKYAFDKLLEEDIPKNMIPNNGYDKGKWNIDIIYDDLKDDYIYTYEFELKKEDEDTNLTLDTDEANGWNDKEKLENPETGAFVPMITIGILIILSIVLFIYLKKRTIFRKI